MEQGRKEKKEKLLILLAECPKAQKLGGNTGVVESQACNRQICPFLNIVGES